MKLRSIIMEEHLRKANKEAWVAGNEARAMPPVGLSLILMRNHDWLGEGLFSSKPCGNGTL